MVLQQSRLERPARVTLAYFFMNVSDDDKEVL